MTKVYYRRIKDGALTIADVPARWSAAVQALLDADAAAQSNSSAGSGGTSTQPEAGVN